mmetsp:Transcript_27217/g.53506  ORF Transcript_27217/g.53506 Transcript_27217/m.53506 type:complete len:234 (+) Transcript_27217:2019-2720(+)
MQSPAQQTRYSLCIETTSASRSKLQRATSTALTPLPCCSPPCASASPCSSRNAKRVRTASTRVGGSTLATSCSTAASYLLTHLLWCLPSWPGSAWQRSTATCQTSTTSRSNQQMNRSRKSRSNSNSALLLHPLAAPQLQTMVGILPQLVTLTCQKKLLKWPRLQPKFQQIATRMWSLSLPKLLQLPMIMLLRMFLPQQFGLTALLCLLQQIQKHTRLRPLTFPSRKRYQLTWI